MISKKKSPEEWPASDQRNYLRKPLLIQKIKVEDKRSVFFGYTKNISRSGMFISSTNPIQPGEQVELLIPLPPDFKETVCCNCEVIWKRSRGRKLPHEPGMGVKFLDMPVEISDRIDIWVKEQNALEENP